MLKFLKSLFVRLKPVTVYNIPIFYNKADGHINVTRTQIRGVSDVIDYILSGIPGNIEDLKRNHRLNLINLLIEHKDFTYRIETDNNIHEIRVSVASAFLY